MVIRILESNSVRMEESDATVKKAARRAFCENVEKKKESIDN